MFINKIDLKRLYTIRKEVMLDLQTNNLNSQVNESSCKGLLIHVSSSNHYEWKVKEGF